MKEDYPIVKPENKVPDSASTSDVLSDVLDAHALLPTLDHSPVHRVFSLVRLSLTDHDSKRQGDAIQSANDRIRYYLDKVHGTTCECRPNTSTHLINGLSSNADFSVTTNQTVWEVREALGKVAPLQSTVFIIASPDGFTTNVPGFMEFFRRFQALNIRFVVIGKTYVDFELSKVLSVMHRKGNGMIGDFGPCGEFVDNIIKVGINKLLYVSQTHNS